MTDMDDHNIKMFNIAKEQILRKLVKERLITKDQANEFDMRSQFVLYKPKWYENYWKAIKGKKESLEDTHVKLVDFLNDDETLNALANQ